MSSLSGGISGESTGVIILRYRQSESAVRLIQ
jgi:hypothetical protein